MKLRTSLRALLLAPLALPLASLLAPSPTALAAPAAAAKGAARFAFPSGRIVYQMTTSGGSTNGGGGTINMTWAKNGAQFRQDMQMNVGRAGTRVPPINTWLIFDGKTAYVAMPEAAGMGKMVLKMSPNASQLKQLSGGANLAGMGSAQGKVIGKGTVLGKPCEIRLANSTNAKGTSQVKVWLWQGLPLRTEIQGKAKTGESTKMTMVATKVDTTLKPAASLFKVPAGYKVQDMSALMKQMGGAMGGQRR